MYVLNGADTKLKLVFIYLIIFNIIVQNVHHTRSHVHCIKSASPDPNFEIRIGSCHNKITF